MENYIAKYPLLAKADGLTRSEAMRVFELTPEPPEAEKPDDYIVAAAEQDNLQYFSYYLHCVEKKINNIVMHFLNREGYKEYTPGQFLDYKQSCVLAMVDHVKAYDPSKGATFLTYTQKFLWDAMLSTRSIEEGASFLSLNEYKNVRAMAKYYNEFGNEADAVKKFMNKANCSEKTARTYLRIALYDRRRVPFYTVEKGENDEEDGWNGDDRTRNDSWNYAETLWNGIDTKEVRDAFFKLSYRQQRLLEERNATCTACKRVSSLSSRKSFEELAIMFEGSSASGAERAYKRAVEEFALYLVQGGVIHAVRLNQKSVERREKKIAAAAYEYQADCDGEWGEIQFDFEQGTAEIVRLAEWDTTKSHIFVKKAIRYIQSRTEEQMQKSALVPFGV